MCCLLLLGVYCLLLCVVCAMCYQVLFFLVRRCLLLVVVFKRVFDVCGCSLFIGRCVLCVV